MTSYSVSKSITAGYLRGLLFLLFLFQSSNLFADGNPIKEQLDQAHSIRSSNYNKFSELLNDLNRKVSTMSEQERQYLYYLNAYKLTYQGNTSDAVPIFKKIIESNATYLVKSRALYTLVNIHAIEQNWADGLFHLTTLLNNLEKINDQETLQGALTVASVFYNQLGQYKLGQEYAERLLLSENLSTRSKCYANTLIYESKLKQNTLAFDDPSKNTVLNECSSEPLTIHFIRSYIGSVYLENGKVQELFDLILPNLEGIRNTKYPRLIVEINSLLANAYLKNGDLEKAKQYAQLSADVGENISTTQAVVSAYNVLYQIAKTEEKPEEALKHHEKYSSLDKAHLNNVKAKHLAFQLAAHKEIEQQSKITLLNEQNALLKVEQELAQKEVENTRLFVGLLATILTGLLYFAYRSWRTQRRLKQLAEYDALTGVFNRGHFNQVAKSALHYCQNTKQNISLIMFDLDHFKSINDKYGHPCGDWALIRTVEVCKAVGRKNDIFARIGGEEFVILLPSCSAAEASARAELYRACIESIQTEESGFEFNITASFGVTDSELSSYDLEKLLKDVDSASYASKNNGRNRVTTFSN